MLAREVVDGLGGILQGEQSVEAAFGDASSRLRTANVWPCGLHRACLCEKTG